MPKGGHNRLPRSVKEAHGTIRKGRENASAPAPPSSRVPPAPRTLSKSERAVWEELAREVDFLGTYCESDLTTFRMMATVVAQVGEGPGDMAASPYSSLVRTAHTLLRSFGLDPASRGRVASGKHQGDGDDAERFFRLVPGGKGAG